MIAVLSSLHIFMCIGFVVKALFFIFHQNSIEITEKNVQNEYWSSHAVLWHLIDIIYSLYGIQYRKCTNCNITKKEKKRVLFPLIQSCAAIFAF